MIIGNGELGRLGNWGLGAVRRLHNKTDLFWLQYLDILSLLPGGIGDLGIWRLYNKVDLLIDY